MNPQQEAVALWRFFESRGFKPSIRSVGRTLRDQGLKFRDDDLKIWLSPFRAAAGNQPEAKIEHAGSSRPQTGSSFTRAANVSLSPNLSLLPTVVEDQASQTKAVKSPKQMGLSLDRNETIAAAKLTAELWHLLEASDSKPQGMTMTGWKQRQMRVARDMVKAGVTPESFSEALESFRAARGYYPRQIAYLQDFMGKQGLGKRRPPQPRLEPGEHAEWDDEAGRWMVGNESDPPTAQQLMAMKRAGQL